MKVVKTKVQNFFKLNLFKYRKIVNVDFSIHYFY